MKQNKSVERMKAIIPILNEAAHSYYNEDTEVISNFEYDALYDELLALEKETGTILDDSPTQSAGYAVVSKLKKSEHEYPALSLDKTKDRETLASWLNNRVGVLSWKMDGLTIVATYENKKLVKAVTRGNGYIGEDVTHNAKHFKGLPQTISFDGKLIVRGEAVMKYKDFERANSLIPASLPKYKNARNLASSTVRLLDARESAQREISFFLFDVVYVDDYTKIGSKEEYNSKSYQFKWAKEQGFNVVESCLVNKDDIINVISSFEQKLRDNEFPSDGLVLIYDDETYGKSLGMTGKYPRNGIAFKWKDETVETTIREIEWSASRTGLLNPVAIFDTVEIEGTDVSRASIHNVSIAKALNLGIGSKVDVYKANMIIPQISKTVSSTGPTEIPNKCPVCGGNVEVKESDGIETLYCLNDACPAKNVGKFSHFVGRDCMNIVGLSDATLEKFIDTGFIREFKDIYHLNDYESEIVKMDGFGRKSYDKLISSIDESRNVKFSAFLNAIGIAGIGKDMAKQISKHLGANALTKFVEKLRLLEDFSAIDGIGEIINNNIYKWRADRKNGDEFANLVSELNISDDGGETKTSPITGKTFVITGSVSHFENRDALKAYIESLGGKTSGSVSAKTDYLINNDILSNSGKNKKAKELGVKIINEEHFLAMVE